MGSVQVGGGSRHQGIPALFREGVSPGDVFPASQQTCVLPPGSPAPPSAFVFLPKPSVGEQGGEALSTITLPWVRVISRGQAGPGCTKSVRSNEPHSTELLHQSTSRQNIQSQELRGHPLDGCFPYQTRTRNCGLNFLAVHVDDHQADGTFLG